MSDNGGHRPIVLYDGDCGFCKVMLAALLTWDRARRLGSAPIQSASGEQLLTTMSERERLASWHVVDVDGEVRSGGAAIPVVLTVVPGGATLARFAARFPRATSRTYEFVASRRALLGRLFDARARSWAEEVIATRSRS